MPSRRKTREFVLQVLFAADAQGRDPQDVMELFEGHFKADEEGAVNLDRVMTDFARDLIDAVTKDKAAIDKIIARLSLHWKLHRINRVDLNILRLAIAEMTTFPDIPDRVSLNEALDLGKKYGADNSSAFINGILDKIHQMRAESASPPDVEGILAELDMSIPSG